MIGFVVGLVVVLAATSWICDLFDSVYGPSPEQKMKREIALQKHIDRILAEGARQAPQHTPSTRTTDMTPPTLRSVRIAAMAAVLASIAFGAVAAHAQPVGFDAYARKQEALDRAEAAGNGGACSIILAARPNEVGFLVPCKPGDRLTLIYAGKFPVTARQLASEMCSPTGRVELDPALDTIACTVRP